LFQTLPTGAKYDGGKAQSLASSIGVVSFSSSSTPNGGKRNSSVATHHCLEVKGIYSNQRHLLQQICTTITRVHVVAGHAPERHREGVGAVVVVGVGVGVQHDDETLMAVQDCCGKEGCGKTFHISYAH